MINMVKDSPRKNMIEELKAIIESISEIKEISPNTDVLGMDSIRKHGKFLEETLPKIKKYLEEYE